MTPSQDCCFTKYGLHCRIKVVFFSHCTNFLGYYGFLSTQNNLINLLSLENHDRMEDYNGKYFGKEEEFKLKNMKLKIFNILFKKSYKLQILI